MKCVSPLIWRIEKISRVFFHFIACQAETKIKEVHQEIVALEHCIAAESPVLNPI